MNYFKFRSNGQENRVPRDVIEREHNGGIITYENLNEKYHAWYGEQGGYAYDTYDDAASAVDLLRQLAEENEEELCQMRST